MIHLKCHLSGKHCTSHFCEHNSHTRCSQDTLEVSEYLTMRRERRAEFLSWCLPLCFNLKWITLYVLYIRLAKCTIWFSAKNGSVHLRFITMKWVLEYVIYGVHQWQLVRIIKWLPSVFPEATFIMNFVMFYTVFHFKPDLSIEYRSSYLSIRKI